MVKITFVANRPKQVAPPKPKKPEPPTLQEKLANAKLKIRETKIHLLQSQSYVEALNSGESVEEARKIREKVGKRAREIL